MAFLGQWLILENPFDKENSSTTNYYLLSLFQSIIQAF